MTPEPKPFPMLYRCACGLLRPTNQLCEQCQEALQRREVAQRVPHRGHDRTGLVVAVVLAALAFVTAAESCDQRSAPATITEGVS